MARTDSPITIFDASEFRPERKDIQSFRNFTNSAFQERVQRTYYQMHSRQTVEFVQSQMDKWCRFDHTELTILEACRLLDRLVDESDADTDFPNSVHAFQTAERIRAKHPNKDWFILTGLVHDLGKIMALYGEEHWAVVGDTFPVGCQFSDQIVFGRESFARNPDLKHPVYSSYYGMYSPDIGLDNIFMSWGHDEYLYRVLKNYGARLPEEAFYIIRFHSFYPWHSDGAYDHLCSAKDREMLKWVQEFNQFDLYSKSDQAPDMDAIMPYYEQLIDKYIPGKLKW